jgi:hypothetical protein
VNGFEADGWIGMAVFRLGTELVENAHGVSDRGAPGQ